MTEDPRDQAPAARRRPCRSEGLDRRQVVCGLAGLGVAVPVLAACGGVEESAGPPAGEAGDVLAATADVPVGGGLLVADQGIFVTQPEAGTFRAFSATCTHQGCTVDARLRDDQIHCSCHGSQFSTSDGAPTKGPADKPLPAVAVKVQGGEVVRA
jgi:Rieske Fe-S protein